MKFTDWIKHRNWFDGFRDSRWVTIGWSWFATLLGKVAEPLLWVTMVYSCYTLAPRAPKVPAGVDTAMFIVQFVALDVGAVGLFTLAESLGEKGQGIAKLAKWLIAITLFTVAYAGLTRILTVPEPVTNAVQVVLVVTRSVMTVFYSKVVRLSYAGKGEQKLHVTSDPEEGERGNGMSHAISSEEGEQITNNNIISDPEPDGQDLEPRSIPESREHIAQVPPAKPGTEVSGTEPGTLEPRNAGQEPVTEPGTLELETWNSGTEPLPFPGTVPNRSRSRKPKGYRQAERFLKEKPDATIPEIMVEVGVSKSQAWRLKREIRGQDAG